MLFTVLTPTYNRAHTLPKVYESLMDQTAPELFEWVVVDDGSTDGTMDLLLDWTRGASFPVRVARQENAGKHVAFNRGVRMALGTLVLTLDSDDRILPDAIARLASHWSRIPDQEEFSGVTGHCVHPDMSLIGMPFPDDVMDVSPLDLMARRRGYVGDKWGCQRTDLLRKHPYPEIPGERFCPEGLVWNRIAASHRMRFVNEPFRVVEYRADGLSANFAALRVQSPQGSLMYYSELAQLARSERERTKAYVNMARFHRHAEFPISDLLQRMRPAGFKRYFLALAGAWIAGRERALRRRPTTGGGSLRQVAKS